MNWLKKHSIIQYKSEECDIFYSPIGRCYVEATPEQYDNFIHNGQYDEIFTELTNYVPITQQRKVETPKDYTLLTVLPNNICNFACSYCYSAQARNGAQLSELHLSAAIDYFFDSKKDGFTRPLTISFMGGGEPMLSWDIVKKGIEYASTIARQRNFKLNLRIITNGSILDEEKILFLKKYGIEVSVSFEIIREIQNYQRKYYDVVFSNIGRLLAHDIPVQINSTITPQNVNRMVEMVERLHIAFPNIGNAMFEPVVAQVLFDTPEDMRFFYKQYIKEFIAARKRADSYGIVLTSFAYLRTIFPLERACPGEFCITAEGDITGCYCVVTDKEPLFSRTKYGTVKNGEISFDIERYEQLISQNVYSKPECDDCEIRWNCGGGCFHQYNSYSIPYRNEVCEFTKRFIEEIVKYKVEKFRRHRYHETQPQLPILFKEEI